MSCDPLPGEQLAAVVTYLEARSPPAEFPPPADLSLWKIERPGTADYRALFRRIGAPWLWFSRLAMADDQLAAIISSPDVELYHVVHGEAGEIGMLELDFREPGECELAFVGLLPEFAGQGHGRWLLLQALHLAWGKPIERVHVHTCTLDHPAALSAYRRAGFVPFKRSVERFTDPRLLGILPRDCAPQIPLLERPA